jgi:hypothetical protein
MVPSAGLVRPRIAAFAVHPPSAPLRLRSRIGQAVAGGQAVIGPEEHLVPALTDLQPCRDVSYYYALCRISLAAASWRGHPKRSAGCGIVE